MTSQKCVIINVILCSFTANGGQGKTNKILEHRENKTSFLDEIKTTIFFFFNLLLYGLGNTDRLTSRQNL